ncbi:MAG: hypothetical protein RIE73_32555 [Coleofasciculus sp. C1-SOL-03]
MKLPQKRFWRSDRTPMGVNLSHITHDRILGVGYGVWGVGESEQFWLTMY